MSVLRVRRWDSIREVLGWLIPFFYHHFLFYVLCNKRDTFTNINISVKARRAFWSLKGIIWLQAVVRGQIVRLSGSCPQMLQKRHLQEHLVTHPFCLVLFNYRSSHTISSPFFDFNLFHYTSLLILSVLELGFLQLCNIFIVQFCNTRKQNWMQNNFI